MRRKLMIAFVIGILVLLGLGGLKAPHGESLPQVDCTNPAIGGEASIHSAALVLHKNGIDYQCFVPIFWDNVEEQLSQTDLDWPEFHITSSNPQTTIEIVYEGETPRNFTMTYRYGEMRTSADVFALCSTVPDQDISSSVECQYREEAISDNRRQLSILVPLPPPNTDQEDVVLLIAIEQPRNNSTSGFVTDGFALILRWD